MIPHPSPFASEVSPKPSDASHQLYRHSRNSTPALHDANHGGISNMRSKGFSTRRVRVDSRQSTSRVATKDFVDWVKEQAARYTEKELADLTGLSIKGARNIKAGEAAPSGKTLSNWAMRCPVFRSEHHFYVGGYSETDPEFQQGLALLMNSLSRRQT